MSFINSHWQKGHVLATSKELMEWQHASVDESYDYLIAGDAHRLWGVLGYISSRRFDPSLSDRNVIWLALWKVADGAPTGLGLRMLNALSKLEPHVALAVNGINLSIAPLYKALKYEVVELRQYFVANQNCRMSIASAPTGYCWPTPSLIGNKWQEMTAEDLLRLNVSAFESNVIAQKTPTYFAKRFFGHPIYQYRVFLLPGAEGDMALIATRIVEHEGARALRIVDFTGNPAALYQAGGGLAAHLEESDAQYADFWAYGMDERAIRATGMLPVDPSGSIVIPNYFEPFQACNGRILSAIRQVNAESYTPMIFRADGDQDRPNLLKRNESA